MDRLHPWQAQQLRLNHSVLDLHRIIARRPCAPSLVWAPIWQRKRTALQGHGQLSGAAWCLALVFLTRFLGQSFHSSPPLSVCPCFPLRGLGRQHVEHNGVVSVQVADHIIQRSVAIGSWANSIPGQLLHANESVMVSTQQLCHVGPLETWWGQLPQELEHVADAGLEDIISYSTRLTASKANDGRSLPPSHPALLTRCSPDLSVSPSRPLHCLPGPTSILCAVLLT